TAAFAEYLKVVLRAEQVSTEAADQNAAAFQDAFQLMREEGATLGNFLAGAGGGVVGSLHSGASRLAQGEVKEGVAAAFEAAAHALGFTSHGNFASAGAAWASAAQHTAAATAWGVLSGGAGAARGAVTGGRGAVPPSTRDMGLST